jgi:hypothetical protein
MLHARKQHNQHNIMRDTYYTPRAMHTYNFHCWIVFRSKDRDDDNCRATKVAQPALNGYVCVQ